VWTEQDEPQAAIGSHLHKLAYPDNFQQHEANHRELKQAYHHEGEEILDLTLRGEYLYTANGRGGFCVYDVANIDQKGFSEHITSSPVSPLGQRTYVRTKYATSVALPSTLGIDPARSHLPENEEQPIPMLYAYVYITDREEGLVIVNVATLVDGNPENNFLKKDLAFNPDGKLSGATHCFVAGHRLYITCRRGLEVVDIADPLKPKIVGELAADNPDPQLRLKNPRAVALQFRYAFVTDEDGLKVIDITEPTNPKLVPGGFVKLAAAQRLYLARTYAYVANGKEGLAIIDIENPEQPRIDQMFNANGALNDTRAVQIGSVNASMFALVADGRNGLRVLQLISPDTVPGHMGFSPRPNPQLIATYPTRGEVVAISRGLDRDRVVDETGDQTVVFGRRGARPFKVEEMEMFYRHFAGIYPTEPPARRTGELYKVDDAVLRDGQLATRDGKPLRPTLEFKSTESEEVTSRPPTDRLMRRGK
ncbi:MAG: hypothetical protein JWR19_3322, partial [Pedosphaera sp.]|nr:hypothetical protein [Pedosphaera sp.]